MKSFSTFITEKTKRPIAVWVVGGAASGKSTVGEMALVKGLRMKLVDPDEGFEQILRKFNLGNEIEKETPEDRKRKEEEKKKLGIKPVSVKDLKDPMDFFKIKKPTVNGAAAIGREIARRTQEDAIAKQDNIVFVETGVQVGKIRNMKKRLEDLGYQTFIVYVGIQPKLDLSKEKNFEAVLDVIKQRSNKRASGGGRKLDDAILRKSLSGQEQVKKQLVPIFRTNVLWIDTSKGSVAQNAAKVKARISKLL